MASRICIPEDEYKKRIAKASRYDCSKGNGYYACCKYRVRLCKCALF